MKVLWKNVFVWNLVLIVFTKIFYVLSLTVNTIFECYSFFKALVTVFYDIDKESNHLLHKEWVLLLLTHVHFFFMFTLILEGNIQVCFTES